MTPQNAILPFLRLVFKDRRNLLKQLLHYTNEADKRLYFQKTYQFTSLPFVDMNQLLGPIDEVLDTYTFLDGTSLVSDILLLKGLCRQYPHCHYMEIGSWRGESLYNVAQVAEKCISISLSKADILAMGMSQEIADSQRLFTKGLSNVSHIEANSQSYDFRQIPDKFDVIFIDGDHSYEGVKSDTENAFGLLHNEESVIVWHDCGNSFETPRYEVMAAILDGCPHDKRKHLYGVTNTLCGIYTTRPLESRQLTFPQFPTKTFSMQVRSSPYSAPQS